MTSVTIFDLSLLGGELLSLSKEDHEEDRRRRRREEEVTMYFGQDHVSFSLQDHKD